MRNEATYNKITCGCGVEVTFNGVIPRAHRCFRCGAALDLSSLRGTERAAPVIEATASGMRRTKKS